jgi:hypothetical protein
MVAIVEAQELEKDLAGVEASISDLVGAEEVEAMAGKTWDFGPSLMTRKMILQHEKDGCIPHGQAKLSQGEIVPTPGKDHAVVFKDYFACGLRLPPSSFFVRC